jgi:hypothetical protein
MRYFFPGLIAGALVALVLISPGPGDELYPEWWGAIKSIPSLEKSAERGGKTTFFVRASDQDYYLLKGNGDVAVNGSVTDGLAAFSGNGRFYVKFQKVGSSVEFFNARGDRFWKLESLEYPYLSHGGKLVLLMNGDHTGIRMVDYNGNMLPRRLSGRTCTVIAFSDRGDYAGVGFIDGSYSFVNVKGKVIGSGMTPKGTIVKGVSVSRNGSFAAVHYGNNRKDYLRVIEIGSGDQDAVELSHVHPVKTSLYTGSDGLTTIIDVDRILNVSSSGRVKLSINIPPKRSGHSAISRDNDVYAVTYTMQSGVSRLLLFRDDGVILLSRDFPSESFLDAKIQGDLVFLRGSDNIFCYSLHRS